MAWAAPRAMRLELRLYRREKATAGRVWPPNVSAGAQGGVGLTSCDIILRNLFSTCMLTIENRPSAHLSVHATGAVPRAAVTRVFSLPALPPGDYCGSARADGA